MHCNLNSSENPDWAYVFMLLLMRSHAVQILCNVRQGQRSTFLIDTHDFTNTHSKTSIWAAGSPRDLKTTTKDIGQTIMHVQMFLKMFGGRVETTSSPTSASRGFLGAHRHGDAGVVCFVNRK